MEGGREGSMEVGREAQREDGWREGGNERGRDIGRKARREGGR